MEFGKHIGKGLWAFADKALPAIYGLGYIFLVVRVLPEQEFGAFVIVQTIFVIITQVSFAFALQPLIKFAAEKEESGSYVYAGLLMQFVLFLLASVFVLLWKVQLANLLDPKHQVNLAPLFKYIPLLLLMTFYRNFAVSWLQAKYRVQKIFWIDAVYFLGVLVGILVLRKYFAFRTANDMLNINLMMIACSSMLAIILTWKELPRQFAIQREAFSSMWNFGKYVFLSNVAYTLFSAMDVFFVSSFAGIVAVATYNAAKAFTRIFDMLSQVLQMFLVPFSSKAYAQQDTKNLTVVAEKAICFSTILMIPAFLVMVFFPEQLLHLIYKGKYDAGVPVLRILSLLAFIIPWAAVASNYVVGMGKVRESLFLSAILIISALVAYALLTPLLGAVGTSGGYIVAYLLTTVLMVKFVQRFIPLKMINVILRTKDVWAFVSSNLLKE